MLIVLRGNSSELRTKQAQILSERLDVLHLCTHLIYVYLAEFILRKKIDLNQTDLLIKELNKHSVSYFEKMIREGDPLKITQNSAIYDLVLKLSACRKLNQNIKDIHKKILSGKFAVAEGDYGVDQLGIKPDLDLYLSASNREICSSSSQRINTQGCDEQKIHLKVLKACNQSRMIWALIYRLVRNVSFFVLRIFLASIKVTGKENIPRKRGFIVVSNHRSHLDPILLGSGNPRIFSFLARDTLFNKPFFSWFIQRLNARPIKRSQGDIKSIVRMACQIVLGGFALCVFPEGTRSTTRELGKGKPGVALMALRSGVPVIPAWIEGSEKVLSKGSKKINYASIEVHYGKPIPLEDLLEFPLNREKYEMALDRIMKAIAGLSPDGK